jgi:hypothetical protein
MLENNIELELLYLEENNFFMKNNRRMIKRQYTLTCEDDFDNIQNGLCPDYALHWPNKENAKYWPVNHDFQGSLEKRLANYHLKRVIRNKINKIKNNNYLPFNHIKKVHFNIFNDIIFFDDDYPINEQC